MTKKRVSFKDAILLSLAANVSTDTHDEDAKLIRQAAAEAVFERTNINLPVDVDYVPSDKPLNTRGIQSEMMSHFIPSKRKTKKSGKVTKGTSAWFNAMALKGVPGSSNNKSYAAIAQMYEDETGCLVVDDLSGSNTEAMALLRRLEHSARNCDTTKENYIV